MTWDHLVLLRKITSFARLTTHNLGMSNRMRFDLVRRSHAAFSSNSRRVEPSRARAIVVSFYNPNIPRRVVQAQKRIVELCLPADVAFEQILTFEHHGDAIDCFMASTKHRLVIVLDIDCVPIERGAFDRLIGVAETGALVGAAQSAIHIDNQGHEYIGPYCLALLTSTYRALGSASFVETPRGDVGEELTYAAERCGVPTKFMWPVDSDDHIWRLRNGRTFGHGTTFEGGFWHAFEIRTRANHDRFVKRCAEFEQLLVRA